VTNTLASKETELVEAGNTNLERRLSTIDLLIKVGCFVSKENNIFNLKMS
jgi:hypothetical protein